MKRPPFLNGCGDEIVRHAVGKTREMTIVCGREPVEGRRVPALFLCPACADRLRELLEWLGQAGVPRVQAQLQVLSAKPKGGAE